MKTTIKVLSITLVCVFLIYIAPIILFICIMEYRDRSNPCKYFVPELGLYLSTEKIGSRSKLYFSKTDAVSHDYIEYEYRTEGFSGGEGITFYIIPPDNIYVKESICLKDIHTNNTSIHLFEDNPLNDVVSYNQYNRDSETKAFIIRNDSTKSLTIIPNRYNKDSTFVVDSYYMIMTYLSADYIIKNSSDSTIIDTWRLAHE